MGSSAFASQGPAHLSRAKTPIFNDTSGRESEAVVESVAFDARASTPICCLVVGTGASNCTLSISVVILMLFFG